MIYQFEYGEIRICGDCPFWSPDMIPLSNCGICVLNFDERQDGEQRPTDCPLVVISKMETTSCEYCERISKYAGFGYATFFEQTAVDEQYEFPVDVMFCPNCGRRLEETTCEK